MNYSRKLWNRARAKLWQSLIWFFLTAGSSAFAVAGYKGETASTLIGGLIFSGVFLLFLISAATECARLSGLAMEEEGHENQAAVRPKSASK